ncbi:hypothetical protein [Hyphomicrobium sp. DY-1]|uniref:hypothetical protein n=1 Tax=Hyphomicrobium sp. DY-1 TaxID=3075650 RepID=UPI0039C41017
MAILHRLAHKANYSSARIVFSRKNVKWRDSVVIKKQFKIASAALMSAAFFSCAAHALTVDESKAIAMDAYIYGYSLITTEVTRFQMTNVDKPDGTRGPMGKFVNIPRYPPADYRGISAECRYALFARLDRFGKRSDRFLSSGYGEAILSVSHV